MVLDLCNEALSSNGYVRECNEANERALQIEDLTNLMMPREIVDHEAWQFVSSEEPLSLLSDNTQICVDVVRVVLCKTKAWSTAAPVDVKTVDAQVAKSVQDWFLQLGCDKEKVDVVWMEKLVRGCMTICEGSSQQASSMLQDFLKEYQEGRVIEKQTTDRLLAMLPPKSALHNVLSDLFRVARDCAIVSNAGSLANPGSVANAEKDCQRLLGKLSAFGQDGGHASGDIVLSNFNFDVPVATDIVNQMVKKLDSLRSGIVSNK